jgi:DNA-binding MarR family transcriptional regulator
VGAISGIFAASGQTCIAGSRLLLHRSIHDGFVERLIEVARSARIGDPMLPDTNVGPITTAPQYRKVLDYMGAARQNVQRIVNDLVKEGLVAFASNPHHRRAPLVVLTDKGRSTFEAAMSLQAPWVNKLSAGLRAEDIETTRSVMATLRRRLESDSDADEPA